MTAASTKIKFLQQPTSAAWVEQAIAHLATILLDHFHCERKAADCPEPDLAQFYRRLMVSEARHYGIY